MKRHSLLIKASLLSFALLLLLTSGCFLDPLANPSRERLVITVEAEELTLNYSQGIYWDEEQFNQEYGEFSADKAKYLEDFAGSFTADHIAPYNLQATNWIVSLISGYELETGEASYSALFQCEVHGAASGTAESPYFRFEWLLEPIFGGDADLYAFEYTLDRTSLIYEGEIDHTPITITLMFPRPIDHCHYHVWYRD